MPDNAQFHAELWQILLRSFAGALAVVGLVMAAAGVIAFVVRPGRDLRFSLLGLALCAAAAVLYLLSWM
jgi:hypothetical protein